jgi:hypothetical protein
MQPNFSEMSLSELQSYVKEHRTDDEAIRELFVNRRDPDEKATWYPAPLDDEGIRIMEEAFRQKIQEISNRQPPTE